MTTDALPDQVDADVRPQDDLFGHINGGWLATAEIPADLSRIGGFVDLVLEAEADVVTILREASAAAADGTAATGTDLQKVGDLFASFMDEDAVEARGAEPLAADLAAIEAIAGVGELAVLLGRLQRHGAGGAFESYVNTDDRRSDRYIVNVMGGGLGLPDEAYYREEGFAVVRAAYVAHVASMLRLVGRSADEAADAADRVMALETRLAAGPWDNVRCRDVIEGYNLMTFAELAAAAPTFDWSAWVGALGGTEEQFAEVLVRQPSYLSVLSEALGEVALDDWKAWLKFHVVSSA